VLLAAASACAKIAARGYPEEGQGRFADDPTNRDLNFTRPRSARCDAALAAEGGDARNLARLASRLARANAAVEVLVDGAERYLALRDREARHSGAGANALDANALMPRLLMPRLLMPKAFARHAGGNPPSAAAARDRAVRHEGPAELGKVEALLSALDGMALDGIAAENTASAAAELNRTLAGALVSVIDAGSVSSRRRPRRHRAG